MSTSLGLEDAKIPGNIAAGPMPFELTMMVLAVSFAATGASESVTIGLLLTTGVGFTTVLLGTPICSMIHWSLLIRIPHRGATNDSSACNGYDFHAVPGPAPLLDSTPASSQISTLSHLFWKFIPATTTSNQCSAGKSLLARGLEPTPEGFVDDAFDFRFALRTCFLVRFAPVPPEPPDASEFSSSLRRLMYSWNDAANDGSDSPRASINSSAQSNANRPLPDLEPSVNQEKSEFAGEAGWPVSAIICQAGRSSSAIIHTCDSKIVA
jgi:hypothetical protein